MASRNVSSGAAPRPAHSTEPDFFSRQITEARRFYLQLNPPRSERLVVISGGNEHCTPDYRIIRRGFPYYAVEFVARGEGTLHIGGQSHPLVTGAIFAYGPGISHDIATSPHRPMDKYFINFSGSAGLKLLRPPAPKPGQIVQSSAPAHIRQIYEDLIDAGRRESPYRVPICAALVEQLLLRIAETAVPLGTIGTESFETYQRCRAHIESQYRQLRGLSEIASRCDVDPAYVCRLFRRYDHQSPWQYVIRLKMRAAAQRLQTHQIRISQVAYELGFSDPFQFSRTFRRVFGMSPRQFVRIQRSQR